MKQTTWSPGSPLENPEWWATQILSSTSVLRRGTPFENFSERADWLALPASYSASLSWLKENANLSTDCASACLWTTKALRKWRLAPSDLAARRKTEAIDGFVKRNAVAKTRGPLPFPFRDKVRSLLARWLPEPEWAGDFTSPVGRFGPGSVYERASQRQRRFLLLAGKPELWLDPMYAYEPSPTDRRSWRTVLGRTVARLCAVPKQYDKDRLITVEPAVSSFRQQLARRVLYESIHRGPLRGSAMDAEYVSGDTLQRTLARLASYDGSLGTLDVTDASDNIPWTHVQDLFPEWVSRMLSFCRSDEFEVNGGTHPVYLYAGMGNATTFVVESLYFASCVAAVSWAIGAKRHPALCCANCSVFGDDIIAPSEVCQAMSDIGLETVPLNLSKSFWEGRFRESCGVFAYRGEDLFSRRVDGYPSRDKAFRASVATLVRDLRSAGFLHQLASRVRLEADLPNVPFTSVGLNSDWCAWDPVEHWPKVRWNNDLQRMEAKVRLPQQVVDLAPTEGPEARAHLLSALLETQDRQALSLLDPPRPHQQTVRGKLRTAYPRRDADVRYRPAWCELV